MPAPGVSSAAREPGNRSLIPAAMLVWGLQFAFLSPTIGLLLVALYDATPRQVGWALAAYHVSGFLSTLVIPAWADRRGDYLRPMMWCGSLSVLLISAIGLSTSLGLAVAALAALGGPGGVGMGLLFAHQRHSGAGDAEVIRTRAVFSFSWVVGPPLATLVIALLGHRAVVWVVASMGIVAVAITAGMLRDRGQVDRPAGPGTAHESSWTVVRRPVVVALLAGFVVLGAANVAAVSVTTLYVTQRLGLDALWGGAALGTAAALEIPALLWLGRLATRVDSATMVVWGALAGVGYGVTMLLARGPLVLIAAQPLNAVFVAAVSGVGMTVVQRVVSRPGLASGLFLNSWRVGAICSGPMVALGGLPRLGYSAVFAACAVAAGLGMGLMAVARGLLSRPVDTAAAQV